MKTAPAMRYPSDNLYVCFSRINIITIVFSTALYIVLSSCFTALLFKPHFSLTTRKLHQKKSSQRMRQADL